MPDSPTRRRAARPPWPIAELVRAQRMACEGHGLGAIARALGRPVNDVNRKLDPEPAARREEFANVGFPHLKGRPGGDLP